MLVKNKNERLQHVVYFINSNVWIDGLNKFQWILVFPVHDLTDSKK